MMPKVATYNGDAVEDSKPWSFDNDGKYKKEKDFELEGFEEENDEMDLD